MLSPSRFEVFTDAQWARVVPLLPSNVGRRGHPFGTTRGWSRRSPTGIGPGSRGGTCRGRGSVRGRRRGSATAATPRTGPGTGSWPGSSWWDTGRAHGAARPVRRARRDPDRDGRHRRPDRAGPRVSETGCGVRVLRGAGPERAAGDACQALSSRREVHRPDTRKGAQSSRVASDQHQPAAARERRTERRTQRTPVREESAGSPREGRQHLIATVTGRPSKCRSTAVSRLAHQLPSSGGTFRFNV